MSNKLNGTQADSSSGLPAYPKSLEVTNRFWTKGNLLLISLRYQDWLDLGVEFPFTHTGPDFGKIRVSLGSDGTKGFYWLRMSEAQIVEVLSRWLSDRHDKLNAYVEADSLFRVIDEWMEAYTWIDSPRD